MPSNIPKIETEFACICNWDTPELAAVISTYISTSYSYSAFFEFPFVSAPYQKNRSEKENEHTYSSVRGEHTGILINNALARMDKVQNLIIAGLTNEQKSYLHFLKHFNVIEINNIDDIDFYLSPFFTTQRSELKCRKDEILSGQTQALAEGKILKITPSAPNINVTSNVARGIVIIEDNPTVYGIVAVNYAHSINATISIVPATNTDITSIVQGCIEEWYNGDLNALKEIEELVWERVNQINFSIYKYATFFTAGIPYSLILKNEIPFTFVHNRINTDHFIINNILFEGRFRLGGAVIFSPLCFEDEETNYVVDTLSKQSFYTKVLLGKEANVYELSSHLADFPYDIFHICSHGGEIKGNTIELSFKDGDNNEHTVEYDEVLSFSVSSRPGLIKVQSKVFYRKFDGLIWKSSELKSKAYKKSVFSDMNNAMHDAMAKDKKVISKARAIPFSCHIACSDSNYQGMMQILACHTSPVVFNNTCYSSIAIVDSFIQAGCRTYIGTLTKVSNPTAITVANTFYDQISNNSQLNAFFSAINKVTTKEKDIYLFWGLHFSTITSINDVTKSRESVFKELLKSFYHWNEEVEKVTRQSIKENIEDKIKWLLKELQPFKADFYSLRNQFFKGPTKRL